MTGASAPQIDLTALVAEPTLRCAPWSLANQVDPAGTAGSASAALFVGWPLPWPRSITEIEALAPVAAAAADLGADLYVVVPPPDGPLPVMLFRRDHEPTSTEGFRTFVPAIGGVDRSEVEAGAGAAPGTAAPPATEAQRADALAAEARRLARIPVADAARAAAEEQARTAVRTHDVFVCAHGARDRCCGSTGTALVLATAGGGEPLAGVDETAGVKVRVWRTSHLGGHRFAPTAVVMPAGTAWAHLDLDGLRRVTLATGDHADLAGRYRGNLGLDGPQAQVVEREAFAVGGWSVLAGGRRQVPAADGGWTALEVDGERWEARVVEQRRLPVPDCGLPIEQAKKSSIEWGVAEVRSPNV